jgi:CRISP-associated protein Cas1
MATLYITEQGVQVHKQGQRLLVKRGAEVLQDIPIIKVDRVVLVGKGVSITTPTVFDLTRRNIDVLYLNSRGSYVSRIVGREHRHSKLRQAQAIAVTDLRQAFASARATVDGKVRNQRVLVQRHAEGAPWAVGALATMDEMRGSLEQARTLDDLRGREGLAAKAYFSIYRKLLSPPGDGHSWGFERREYYPPPDPINALLSFGYTMLLQDFITACQISGLDPDLGFFHTTDYNKPSMALDLLEPFRPIIVDSIVLTAVNRKLFSLKDFEIGQSRQAEPNQLPEDARLHPAGDSPPIAPVHPNRSIFLKETARKRFFALYETRVNEVIFYPPLGEQTTYKRIFELQAYSMAKTILGEVDAYAPFTVR